ncbi:hypothetical protein K7X08_003414 [Anisodus acutangulus]|uniref:Uncharacterized protein n=1 Tax=Anisodus acutangulus TaxID=402998 RepID=A0A9Q1MIH2_9SOLA|nr:hypothetical protein K7X08_003414 [Anisodus acutangulus]
MFFTERGKKLHLEHWAFVFSRVILLVIFSSRKDSLSSNQGTHIYDPQILINTAESALDLLPWKPDGLDFL